MKFTNRELGDIKKQSAFHGADIFQANNELQRLIFRLEAAEQVISESFDPHGMAHIGSDSWHKAYMKWQKASGK